MQAGDYGEERSEPWTYRKRIVPRKTWSGRVLYRKRARFWKIEDVQRIIAKLDMPPETEDSSGWAALVIATLRSATLGMLDKLLWFMDSGSIEQLYEFGIGILDHMFGIDQAPSRIEGNARRLIIQIADRAGLTVTIKKG